MTSRDGPRLRLHADQVDSDAALVRHLLADQFPQWAGRSIRPVNVGGASTAIYRLGDDLAVRLPLRPDGGAQIAVEYRWLPYLAPHLPVAIPRPLAMGAPGEAFPLPWLVCTWLQGETPDPENLGAPESLADDLAQFLLALRRIDAMGGPRPRRGNYGRGLPLATRDGAVRESLKQLHGVIDVAAAASIWDADMRAAAWSEPPQWIHGDLNAGNLLVREGRLSGVIDFGALAIGDPACDLLAAWYVLPAGARDIFRSAIGADAASWARGRGWALSMALMALPYYKDSQPMIAAGALRTIDAILADRRR